MSSSCRTSGLTAISTRSCLCPLSFLTFSEMYFLNVGLEGCAIGRHCQYVRLCLFKRCMTDDMCMSLNVHYVCICTWMNCRTESRTHVLTGTIKYIVSYLKKGIQNVNPCTKCFLKLNAVAPGHGLSLTLLFSRLSLTFPNTYLSILCWLFLSQIVIVTSSLASVLSLKRDLCNLT